MPLYHVANVPEGSALFQTIKAEFPRGFAVDSIIEIQNSVLFTQYCVRREAVRLIRGDANEKIVYHVSKGALHNICQDGLDNRLSQRGFFGRGLYVTSDPMKANDYSTDKGNPEALRMMLRCQVVLGKSKEYEVGRFDRDLMTEPEGFDSVQGFIRRGTEYVVYSQDRIYISHIVFYRFVDRELELTPSFNLPPNVSGQIVYITASLSEFFGKLQQRAAPDQQVAVKRLIASLLKRTIEVADFLTKVSDLLKAAPPADLAGKLEKELEKCKMPPDLQQGAAASASSSVQSSTEAAAATTVPATSSAFPPSSRALTGTAMQVRSAAAASASSSPGAASPAAASAWPLTTPTPIGLGSAAVASPLLPSPSYPVTSPASAPMAALASMGGTLSAGCSGPGSVFLTSQPSGTGAAIGLAGAGASASPAAAALSALSSAFPPPALQRVPSLSLASGSAAFSPSALAASFSLPQPEPPSTLDLTGLGSGTGLGGGGGGTRGLFSSSSLLPLSSSVALPATAGAGGQASLSAQSPAPVVSARKDESSSVMAHAQALLSGRFGPGAESNCSGFASPAADAAAGVGGVALSGAGDGSVAGAWSAAASAADGEAMGSSTTEFQEDRCGAASGAQTARDGSESEREEEGCQVFGSSDGGAAVARLAGAKSKSKSKSKRQRLSKRDCVYDDDDEEEEKEEDDDVKGDDGEEGPPQSRYVPCTATTRVMPPPQYDRKRSRNSFSATSPAATVHSNA